MTREEFIEGLREAADFLEANPSLPIQSTPLTVNVFVETKEELAAIARTGHWDKDGNENHFWIHRMIGSVSYEVNISRNKICRRVVTGTRVVPAREAEVVEQVEWVCDEPLLAVQS